MNVSPVTCLWLTPAPGDESRLLLSWHPGREQFELPTLPGTGLGRGEIESQLQRLWGPDLAGNVRIAERPLARLSLKAESEGSAAALSLELHGVAFAASTRAFPGLSRRPLEWVSFKDLAMGFTSNGRSVDPLLRDILELTGRRPRTRQLGDDVLTVGVTGHRDPAADDIPVLFDKLHQALKDLTAEFPGRRLQVISSLAEGAERLMADVAMERGVPLIAPLPLPLEIYEKDFTSLTALGEFWDTLGRCVSWYALPTAPGVTWHELASDDAVRSEHCAQLGRHIVHHSDVLLALWDGRPSTSVGETADVLRYALETHRRPGQRLLIRHVPTRRERHRGRL